MIIGGVEQAEWTTETDGQEGEEGWATEVDYTTEGGVYWIDNSYEWMR